MTKKLITLACLLLSACVAPPEKPQAGAPNLQGSETQNLQQLQGAAERGDAQAQFNLGVMYEHGQGVAQDYAKAREWFEKAAAQNLAQAQYNLGAMYYRGRGVAQDDAKAREWFEKAAAQGDASAQYITGMMYASGIGGPEDLHKARMWLEKTAAQTENAEMARRAREEMREMR